MFRYVSDCKATDNFVVGLFQPKAENILSYTMRKRLKAVLGEFAIYLGIYSAIVTIYLLFILSSFSGTLSALSESNLIIYSILALALILIQGVILENVTSFIMDRIGFR